MKTQKWMRKLRSFFTIFERVPRVWRNKIIMLSFNLQETLKFCFSFWIAGNLITFSYGTTTSWAASNYVVLTSPQSPLKSGPLTMAEGSMVVSLLCMGGLLGTILAVMAVDRYGRKTSLIFLAIPQIVINLHFFRDFIAILLLRKHIATFI